MAVWIRLPELPIEYYDPVVLRKIGEAIGTVLRIDAYTANGARGRFARLCVQVNLDKPLIKTVKIGRLAQIVLYEGLNSLCFECGRIGHRKETCPYVIKGPQAENPQGTQDKSNILEEQNVRKEETQTKFHCNELDGYGQWMVVTRKKKAQTPRLAGHGEGLASSGGVLETRDRRDSKHKAGVYTDSPKTGVAEKTSTSTQKWQSAGRREIKQGNKATGSGHRNVGARGNKAGLKIFKAGSSSGLGAEPKEGQIGPTTFNKGLDASVGSPVFRFGSPAVVEDHGESTGKVGDIL